MFCLLERRYEKKLKYNYFLEWGSNTEPLFLQPDRHCHDGVYILIPFYHFIIFYIFSNVIQIIIIGEKQ